MMGCVREMFRVTYILHCSVVPSVRRSSEECGATLPSKEHLQRSISLVYHSNTHSTTSERSREHRRRNPRSHPPSVAGFPRQRRDQQTSPPPSCRCELPLNPPSKRQQQRPSPLRSWRGGGLPSPVNATPLCFLVGSLFG